MTAQVHPHSSFADKMKALRADPVMQAEIKKQDAEIKRNSDRYQKGRKS